MVALADDSSAVWWNPAGMVGPKKNTSWDMELGGYYINIKMNYNNGPLGQTSTTDYVIPSFFITKRFNDNWAVGYGSCTPFGGGGSHYPNFLGSDYTFRYVAGWTDFIFAAAYKINDQWQVGAGLDIYVGQAHNQFADFLTGRKFEAKYFGYSGIGGHVSLMYRPSEPWSIGFTFRTPVSTNTPGWVKINGEYFSSNMEITFPAEVDLSVAYNKGRLKIGGGVSVYCYSRTLGLSGLDSISVTTDGIRTDTSTGYRTNFMVSLGGEYQIGKRTYLIFGPRFISGATKRGSMSPLSCDTDKFALALGLRFPLSEQFEMQVGYERGFGFQKTVDNQKFDNQNDFGFLGIRRQW